MRKDSLEMVYEHAKLDDRVVFIGSDLGPGTLQKFQDEMPERYFIEGVSEANVIGIAAGMAAEGHVVYVNTIAVFLTRRVYEQVALDVCLRNLDVRLIGNGGGLVYAPLGPTHLAIDDIALMRALPNMRVIAPADAIEMRQLMRGLRGESGPAYIRVGKGNEPDITPDDGTAFASARVMRAGTGTGAVIATTGVTLHTALAALDLLPDDTPRPTVLHFPVLKPLDTDTLAANLGGAAGLIVVEEHVPTGGLAGAIADWMILRDDLRQVRVRRLGLPDHFPDHYGSQFEHFDHYGITAARIVEELRLLHAGDA